MDTLIQKFMTKTDEEIAQYLAEYAQKHGAARQLAWLNGFFNKTWQGGTPRVTLADSIMRDQKAKIERWGDRAFPLTEKQIAVIVREMRIRFDTAMAQEA